MAIDSGNFDIEGLSRALRFTRQGDEIHMRFPMFRNKVLTLFAIIFAAGFGFASYSIAGMAEKGGLMGLMLAIFGIPFFVVALLAAMAAIYLPLNNLQVTIRSGEMTSIRRLLFIPLFKRHVSRNEITRLSLKRSGSTGQGVDKVEHFKLKAHVKNGSSVTVAEDLDGEAVAAHFRDYLAQRLQVESG